MSGINKVIIVGRLGNEPELRTMPNGEAVANISVASVENLQNGIIIFLKGIVENAEKYDRTFICYAFFHL